MFALSTQIFDAFIIVSSFTIDIIFLGGVSGEEGQKAAAVLVILLLWRIARVVDGINLVVVRVNAALYIRVLLRYLSSPLAFCVNGATRVSFKY